MRFLWFVFIALSIGGLVGVVAADRLEARQLTADDVTKLEVQYNLGLLQDTADQAAKGVWPPQGQTPFVPPKPSWPVAHPWVSGFVAACIAALVTWIVALIAFGGSPSPAPTADQHRASAPDRLPTPPGLFLVPGTNRHQSPRTPADS